MQMFAKASLVALVWVATVSQLVAQDVSFREDVAPILVKQCLTCHGEHKFKGEYQLHTFETLMQPGETGEAAIVPGKPDDSYLLQLLTESDVGSRMPKDADALAEADIEVIRRWIAAGAKFDGTDKEEATVSAVIGKHPEAPASYPRPFPVTALAFSPDGKKLAVGGHHEITIWNAEDGNLLRRIGGIAERTYALAYNHDGSLLVAASGTPGQLGEVKLVNPVDGKLVRHLASMTDCALGVAFSSDGKRLAACGADHNVRVFDVATGEQELQLDQHSDWVMDVAFSHDGAKLATASRDNTAKVFDAESGELLLTYPDHRATVYAVEFSADGNQAISCGADNRIHIWHPTDQGYEDKEMKKKKRQQIGTVGGFGGNIFDMTIVEGQIFACSADKTARQYDAQKRNQIRQYSGHQEWLYALSYHKASKRMATASLDGQVRVWNVEAKDEKDLSVATFIAAPGYVPVDRTAQTSEGEAP